MKIYTKTGDDGMTSLFGGGRLAKSHIRIESYGTIDELNAWMGFIRDLIKNVEKEIFIKEIQDRLFTIGSSLAADPTQNMIHPDIQEQDLINIEADIDQMQEKLSPLRHFILPGGHSLVSQIHIARTVCRRAERRVVALDFNEKIDPLIIIYLNRLSDWLFVLSRWAAKMQGVEEIKWIPRNK